MLLFRPSNKIRAIREDSTGKQKNTLLFEKVSGILSTNPSTLKFSWLSFRALLASSFLGLCITNAILVYRRTFQSTFHIGVLGGLVFFTVCAYGVGLFFNMALKWKRVMTKWYEYEGVFLVSPYVEPKVPMARKIRVTAFTIFLLALVEHLLFFGSAMYKTFVRINTPMCNATDTDLFATFIIGENGQFFLLIPYSLPLGLLAECLTIGTTFCWNCIDVFIVVISIGVATRFQQINERLEAVCGMLMPASFWKEVRQHYVVAGDLLYYVDQHMAKFILLSCASNLYFVCAQLFNSFLDRVHMIQNIYFWYSLIFVVCRMLSVLFFAASIHDNSKRPLRVLRFVPSEAWIMDTQRLSDLVAVEVNALSGKQFFFLTRKLILTMIGTIVTYELVLMDNFTESTKDMEKNVCN